MGHNGNALPGIDSTTVIPLKHRERQGELGSVAAAAATPGANSYWGYG